MHRWTAASCSYAGRTLVLHFSDPHLPGMLSQFVKVGGVHGAPVQLIMIYVVFNRCLVTCPRWVPEELLNSLQMRELLNSLQMCVVLNILQRGVVLYSLQMCVALNSLQRGGA